MTDTLDLTGDAAIKAGDYYEHAIDFITGSGSFPPRKVASSHATSVLQSPMHLSESRKIYVRGTHALPQGAAAAAEYSQRQFPPSHRGT